jgi:subtilisin family serine protease
LDLGRHLLLAIAAIGFGGARNSGALAQPAALIKDLLKKKGTEKAKVIPGKNQLTTIPGKGGIPGSKGGLPGAPGGPKSAIGTAPGGNVGTAKGSVSPGTAPNVALPKGTDSKNATGPLPKGTDTKGTTTSALPKGTDTKGTTTSALPKGTDIKGTNPKAPLSKAGDPKGAATAALPKGTTTAALPKGTSPQGALRSSPHFAATAPQRMQLRTDHRMAIVAAQRRLPPRPFPGERGFTGVPPVGETRFVSTEMMFRTGPNVTRQAVDNAARQLGLTVISAQDVGITGGTVYHFRLVGRQVADVVRALETQNIGIAQPNYTYRLFQEPELAAKSETAGSDQYVVGKLNLDEAHRIAKGANVLIAVIDSAIDVKHPDLAGAIIEQYDAVGRAEKPHPHGTGMTGAIAAHQKLMGIAPDAKILAVRAFTSGSAQSPEATTRNILTGMEWAISKGARIINMSFAGPYDPMLQVAMKNAHAKGVVLIAASGNQGPKSPPLYPAADPHVIAVTAIDENDQLFAKAVRGPHVAIASPGVDVMVPAPDETYQMTTGTSVAAAHVSGVAALLIERHPTADAATILEVLTASAKRLNPKGRDDLFGWGLVDPTAALAELESRMADGKVATAAAPAVPKPAVPAAPKPATPNAVPAPKAAASNMPAPKQVIPRPFFGPKPAAATAQ